MLTTASTANARMALPMRANGMTHPSVFRTQPSAPRLDSSHLPAISRVMAVTVVAFACRSVRSAAESSAADVAQRAGELDFPDLALSAGPPHLSGLHFAAINADRHGAAGDRFPQT
jgi:hypothetical protein